jgi:hypothetical protein
VRIVAFSAATTPRVFAVKPPASIEGVSMELAPLQETGPPARSRRPSRLAQELSDAFAPCGEWSEVRVIRQGSDRRAEVIVLDQEQGDAPPYDWAGEDAGSPYDWAEAA